MTSGGEGQLNSNCQPTITSTLVVDHCAEKTFYVEEILCEVWSYLGRMKDLSCLEYCSGPRLIGDLVAWAFIAPTNLVISFLKQPTHLGNAQNHESDTRG